MFWAWSCFGLAHWVGEAEKACGVLAFDWVQIIDRWPSPSDLFSQANQTTPIEVPPELPPYDPPQGGYTYQVAGPLASLWSASQPNFATAYPFYYSPLDLGSGIAEAAQIGPGLPIELLPNTLNFLDSPRDPCIPFGVSFNSGICQTLAGAYMSFTTQLVGVLSCDPSSGLCSSSLFMPSAPLFTWTWSSDFNGCARIISGAGYGCAGGVFDVQSSGIVPPLPGSGAGGVTVTGINGVPSPPISASPSAGVIDFFEPVSVAITVAQFQGNSQPDGTVTIVSGSYTSAPSPLANSIANITIPGGSLPVGSDTLTAVYTPATAASATYGQAWGIATVTVNPSTPQLVFAPTPVHKHMELQSRPVRWMLLRNTTGTRSTERSSTQPERAAVEDRY